MIHVANIEKEKSPEDPGFFFHFFFCGKTY